MLSLGMDIGTSTVKLVLLKNQEIEKQWMAVHHGNPFVCLKKGLSTLELAMDTPFSLCVTGSNTEALLEQDSSILHYLPLGFSSQCKSYAILYLSDKKYHQ